MVAPPPDLLAALDSVRSEPHEVAAWEDLEAIAAKHELPEQAFELYREVLLRDDVPATVAEQLTQRAVRFHDEWFEDPFPLAEILSKLLVGDPDAGWAFERLTLLFTAKERWDDLFELYDRVLAATKDATRKRELLDEAAHAAKDLASRPDRAITYLIELAPLRPTDAQLAASLERLLEARNRHADLVKLWTVRLPVLPPPAQAKTRHRIAATWLDKLSDPAAALAAVLPALDGSDEPAAACELVERIGATETAETGVRRAAFDAVAARYAKAERAADVVRVLAARVPLLDAADQGKAHREVAKMLLDLDRTSESQDHEALALACRPDDGDARDALVERAATTGRFADAIDALARAARSTEDHAVRQSLLTVAAGLAETKLSEPTRAIELFESVFDDPSTPVARRIEVGTRLDALLTSAARPASLARVLGQLAALSDEASRATLLLRKARLHEEVGEEHDALATYREVTELRNDDQEAHDAIVRILTAQSEHPALVVALRRRASLGDVTAKRRDLSEAASLVASSGDAAAAIEAWREIERELGRDDASIDALSMLFLQSEQHDELDALLSSAAKEASDTARRAELCARRGDLARMSSGAEATALAAYRDALTADPKHVGARAGLKALAGSPVGSDAIEALVAALDRAGDQAQKVGLLETRLALAKEPLEQAMLLLEASSIHEQLGHLGRALDAVARAFALTPDDVSLEAEAVRLGAASGDAQRLAQAYVDALAQDGLGAERRQALGVSLADVRDRDLGDLEGAVDALSAVTDVVPAHPTAAPRLVSAACRAGQYHKAAQTLAAACGASPALGAELFAAFDRDADPSRLDSATSALVEAAGSDGLPDAARHAMLTHAAITLRDRVGDRSGAERALTGAAEADPTNKETLRALADLRRDAPGRPLVGVLLALADLDDEVACLEEAAIVAQDTLSDAAAARKILERLMKLASKQVAEDPDRAAFAIRVLDRLVAACRATGDAGQAVGHIWDACGLALPATERARLLYLGAEIAEAEVGDLGLTIKLYRAIVDGDIGETRAVEALALALAKNGEHDARAELRDRELAVSTDSARKIELRLDLASLRERGGAREQAVAALEANLEDLPGEARTIAALKALLSGDADQRRLAEILLREADKQSSLGNEEAAVTLFADVASLADQRLSDSALAIRAYRRVVAHAHQPDAIDALARLLLAEGSPEAAAQLLTERLTHATTDRADVALRLAEALRKAGNAAKAREVLEAATNEHPRDRDLRGTLADIYRTNKAYEPLVALLTRAASMEEEPETRVAMLLEVAGTQQKRLARPADAIATLRTAIDVSPQDRVVRAALADALRSAGELDEARDILLALIEEFGRRRPAERAVLHLHLAAVSRERGDLDEALAQLDVAASMDMTHAGVLRMLGETAEEKGQLDRAERAFRSLLLVVRRQKPEVLASPSATGQTETLHSLSRLARKQGDEARATELLETAFEVAMGAPLEADALERVLTEEGRHDLLLRLLSARRATVAGTADEVPFALAIGEALAGLGRHAEAVDELMSVIALAPGDARALGTLRAAARVAGRSGAVRDKLDTLLRNKEGAERRILILALAELLAEDLSDAAGAAKLLREAVDDPDAPIAVAESLVRLAGAAGDTESLRRGLSWMVDAPTSVVTQERAASALLSLAELDIRDDEAAAIDAIERAIERDSRHREGVELLLANASTGSVALADALERAARASTDASLLFAALDAATARRQREGASTSILDGLREAAELLPDDPRTAGVLRRAVEVAEALPEGAREGVWAASRLTQLSLASGELDDAVRYAEIVALEESTEASELVLETAGTSRLALPNRAAKLYEVLLAREPTERRAYDGLLSVFEANGQSDLRLALLERTIEAVLDGGERQRMRTARAKLLIELERDDEAADALRDVLADDPDDVSATTVLADLFAKHGRNDDLAELLERQLEGARMRRDADAVSQLTLRVSGLLGGKVDTRRELLERSLEVAPDDRAMLAALSELLGESDPMWLTVSERLVAVETANVAATLALRLADLHRAADDRDAEERVLTLGLSRAPAHDALFNRLVADLAEADRWSDVMDATLARAAAETDLETSVMRYRQAAAIARERTRDPGRAVDALSTAFTRAPNEIALLSEMVEILVESGDLAGAEETVVRALPGREGQARASILRLRAWIALRQGSEASAVADLEEALALGDADAREELKGALGQAASGAERQADLTSARPHVMRLIALLETDDPAAGDALLSEWVGKSPRDEQAIAKLLDRGEATRNPSLVVDAALRLANLTSGESQIDAVLKLARAARAANRLDEARGAMERAFQANPSVAALRDELRDLYESSGAMAELAEILLADAESLEGVARFNARRRAGEALLQAGDLGRAAEALEAALAEKPGDHETTVHLADAWTSAGMLDKSTALIDAAIAAHKGRRSRELAVLQHRMARIALAAGDRNVEMAWLNVALDADMQNGVVASELADVATELGQLEVAQKALRAITMLKTPGPMSKPMAYLRQGMIAKHVGDPRRAVLLARKALSEDPQLAEARTFLQEMGEKV